MAFLGLFKNTKTDEPISNPIEAVTATAALVSNVREIDPLLDEVRTISAELQLGQALSSMQTQVLLRVYLQLEAYLVTKEPLRSFNKEGLRKRLSQALVHQLEAIAKEN